MRSKVNRLFDYKPFLLIAWIQLNFNFFWKHQQWKC
jgi:hypothetical protein